MATDQKEFSRVLSNPNNVILSDELYELLETPDDPAVSHTDSPSAAPAGSAVILFDEEAFPCEVKKVTRHDHARCASVFKFVLFVPDLPIDVILNKSSCALEINEYKFFQIDHSSSEWIDNHLTIKTRRDN